MITKETVEAALGTSDSRFNSCHGWFSNGHFAVKGDQWVALASENRPEIAESINKWHSAEKEPVLEAVELRIPTIEETEECSSCDGFGRFGHSECPDCNGHDCEECEGGKYTSVEVGQTVFTANGQHTVIDPRFGALFDGLTVYREITADRATAMILGYDNGELVAAAMPRVDPVRKVNK